VRRLLTALDYVAGTTINLAIVVAGFVWELAIGVAIMVGIAIALRLFA